MTTPDPLVLTWPEVLAWRAACRARGETVVLTNGCFDLLHRGHLDYLRRSAALGARLLVAINSDASVRVLKGPSRPVTAERDRAWAVASLRGVDATFIFEGPRLAREISALQPDLYTKAGDYTLDTLEATERAALQQAGTQIVFMPFVGGYSTTATLAKL